MAKNPSRQRFIKMTSARPAGTLDEFRQIRPDTDRAHVLKLMNGTKSVEQIAIALGGKFTARYVLAHAYCLRRDCGIGYRLTDNGKLLALYPGDHTYRDTVIQRKKKVTAPSRRTEDAVSA